MSHMTAEDIAYDLAMYVRKGEANLKAIQETMTAKLVAGQELGSFDIERLMTAQAENVLATWIKFQQKDEDRTPEQVLKSVRRQATQAVYSQSHSTSLADRAQDEMRRSVMVDFLSHTDY